MKRVLLVVGSYRPVMLADMQRARMLAWELPRCGWEMEILTPGASEVRQDAFEPDAMDFFPADVPIHEVGSICRRFFELLGSRTHAWRTLLPVYRRGCQLLGSGRFNLVFFSTTTFVYFALGPLWARQYKIPYVLDFHDPWVKQQPMNREFSGGWKNHIAEALSENMERSAVVRASGMIAVSPQYLNVLKSRYLTANPAWLAQRRHDVVPFGALEKDFNEARQKLEPIGRRPTTIVEVVYVGAGGHIMERGFSLLCRSLAAMRGTGDQLVERLRIKLFGTLYGWHEGDTKVLTDVASRYGVGNLLIESPARISYRRSIELLLQADGVLVLGVNDESYMPSKLFTYALSGKPLLATLRWESQAYAHFQSEPGLGHVLWFHAQGEMPLDDAASEVTAFLKEAAARKTFDRRVMLEPFLAPAMARRHAELFDACIENTATAAIA